MKTKTKPSILGPILVCALALALLAGLALLLVLLMHPAPTAALSQPVQYAIELDEGWENWFLTGTPTEEQLQQYLDGTLAEAGVRGADTLLLTARAGGGLLFHTKDKTLAPVEAVTANDRLFHKFDPIEYLVKQANAAGIQLALLATDETGNPLTSASAGLLAGAVRQMAERYQLAVFAPEAEPVQPGVTAYTDGTRRLLRADGAPAVLAALLRGQKELGVVLGGLTALQMDDTNAAVFAQFAAGDRAADTAEPLLAQPVPQTVGISYPADDAVLYTDTVFVMGTSDPNQALTVNGQTVERYGSRGVWGLELPVSSGVNTITAVQGGESASISFNRRAFGGGGGGSSGGSDGSVAAPWGKKLRINTTLASVLSQPGNSDSIMMTAYEGAVAEVAQSLPIRYNGKNSFAYQLQSGDFVLAKDCELIDAPDAAFTGVTVQELDNGDEILRFEGSGTPLYYHSWEGNVLTLSFYSAGFTGQWPAATEMVQSFEQGEVNSGFSVTMTFAENAPLWGYYVDYIDGTSQIYLKRTPRRDASDKPLTGVSVLLDPGHGDTDAGAMGAAGVTAPQEKDVNLALGLAAKARLEQLGATVTMTRDTDVFYTLGERVEMLNGQKPDFFIALHHNSAALTTDLTNRGGIEAYWFYTEGRPLAERLVERIGTAAERRQRGVYYDYYYVTRSNICPAVLLETGFVTDPVEYEKVADETMIWVEAGSIAQAVLDCVPG